MIIRDLYSITGQTPNCKDTITGSLQGFAYKLDLPFNSSGRSTVSKFTSSLTVQTYSFWSSQLAGIILYIVDFIALAVEKENYEEIPCSKIRSFNGTKCKNLVKKLKDEEN